MTVSLLDDGTHAVLGGSFDPAQADSAVLSRLAAEGADLDRAVLVRHHLTLPGAAAVDRARTVLEADGYALVAEPAAGKVVEPAAGKVAVRASRMETVSALSIARERTRMASLAQRLGGDALGWDLCGPS